MRHFMKTSLNIIFATFLLITLSCNKNEKIIKSEKKALLIATQNFNDLVEINRTFKIFSDSTFTFTESLKELNHSKNEIYKGFVKISKDSIKFFPFKLGFNNSETAVLKNGFLEFIDGENPGRMKIEKTNLNLNNNLDLNKFPNYAIFTFHKQDLQKDYSNYDLSNSDLIKVDQILKNEISNNNKLRNFDEYLKQIISMKNNKNEILIRAHFFCKTPHLIESFQYYETKISDGSNCNVYLELNLTTGKFNFINIAGAA